MAEIATDSMSHADTQVVEQLDHPTEDPADAATALHVIFPNLRFALSDIETDGAGHGVWLVPVPRTIGLLVDHGTDFAWTEVFDFEGPMATAVATISIEAL
jgi:hypothetical protein